MAFFIPIIVGLVALAGGAWWVSTLKGKKFAVLGPVAAGKTTFINFLRTGEVTLSYDSTTAPAKLNGQRIKLKEYELKIDDVVDVPGDKDFHPVWMRQVSLSDVVCYIFDASRFVDGDSRYIDLVTSEMRHVNEWRKKRAAEHSPFRFFLLATHLDRVPEYRNADQAGQASYVSTLWKTPNFEKLCRVAGGAAARCLSGSLSDKKACERLVGQVISEVATAG